MKKIENKYTVSTFENIKHADEYGNEFWYARELSKEIAKADVWNTEYDEETLVEFLDYRYYPKFLDLRFNKDAASTDRESAIMFGLPPKLIEGVFVGRKIENDKDSLNYIKSKLPDCYICNLEGKVIVGNKKINI